MTARAKPHIWYDQNTNLIRLRWLYDRTTATYVSTGVTITAEIWPVGGTGPIPGGSVTLTPDGPGQWSAAFPATLDLTVGGPYEMRVRIDGGSTTAQGYFSFAIEVQPRSA